VAILYTILKNHEETERSYIQYGPFFKQQKSLKHLPLDKQELHLLHGSNKHLKLMLPWMLPTSRRGPCTLLLIWELPTFQLPMDGSAYGSKDLRDTILYTELIR
jgi:hypothetical protein